MAERTVSTRLVLAGEAEYRAASKQINAELTTMRSTLRLVDSEFKGQANSMAALQSKQKALTDAIGKLNEKLKAESDALKKNQEYQKQAATQIEATKTKIAAKTAELEKLKKSSDDTTKEEKELTEEIVRLNAELNKSVAAEQAAAAAIQKHQTAANKAQTELNNFNGELTKTDKYLDEAKRSADGCASSIDEYGKETKEAKKGSEEFGEKSSGAINQLAGALAAAGIAATVKEIADALMACVDASIRFESAMAGVAKTTNLSDTELASMSEAIKELTLTIPIASTEFAGIAEVAGQLGVPKDKLLAFSEVMANLGVATNMTSEEAATMLAQFANVTGMDTDQYSNLGAAIVALGNNFATNELNITAMSQRLAAAGTLAGMTEPEILALATAMSSVGIEAEAGGTAMTQTLAAIEKAVASGGDSLKQFSSIAGMTSSEFATTWRTAPVDAIQAFIGGLGGLKEQGSSATLVLEEMGLSGIRQSNMLLSLALASDKLNTAVNLSNKAWEENTALTKEAETRYATTESKIQLFKNSVENLKVAVGDQLTPALGELADAGADVTAWAADFIQTNEWLVPTITGVVAALSAMAAGVVAVTVVIPALKAAWVAFQAAAGPVGWIMLAISAIVGLGAAIAVAAANTETETEKTRDMIKAMEEARQEAQANADAINAEKDNALDLVASLDKLIAKESKTATEKQIIKNLVEKLNAAVPGLTLAYDEQADALVDLSTGAEMSAKSIAELAEAQADAMVRQNDIDSLAQMIADSEMLTRQLADLQAQRQKIIDTPIEERIGAFGTIDSAELYDLNRAIDELTVAQTENNAAIEEARSKYDAFDTSIDGVIEAQRELGESLIVEAESIEAQFSKLDEVYAQFYDDTYSIIANITGLYGSLKEASTTSYEDFVENLDAQITALSEYNAGTEELIGRNIDGLEKLVEQYSDGSQRSIDAIASLRKLSDDEIRKIIEKLEETKEGTDAAAANAADLKTKYDAEYQKIIQATDEMVANFNQQSEAYANGMATAQGVADGLNSQMATIRAAVDAINRELSKAGSTSRATLPGHAAGLEYVPYDDYVARLHEGEMVLTALEAKAYRAESMMNARATVAETKSISNTTRNDYSRTFNPTINVYSQATTGRGVANDVVRELRTEMRYKGVVR